MTEKPQVYVNVSGGIAEATVTRGDVDVIQIDWDNVNDESDIDTLREYRSELEQVADEEYRTRLLADMDEVIEKAIAEEEDAEIDGFTVEINVTSLGGEATRDDVIRHIQSLPMDHPAFRVRPHYGWVENVTRCDSCHAKPEKEAVNAR